MAAAPGAAPRSHRVPCQAAPAALSSPAFPHSFLAALLLPAQAFIHPSVGEFNNDRLAWIGAALLNSPHHAARDNITRPALATARKLLRSCIWIACRRRGHEHGGEPDGVCVLQQRNQRGAARPPQSHGALWPPSLLPAVLQRTHATMICRVECDWSRCPSSCTHGFGAPQRGCQKTCSMQQCGCSCACMLGAR